MRAAQSRRGFMIATTAAGMAGLIGPGRPLAEEGPPETTTIRLGYDVSACLAPLPIAEGLLRAEGFTEIRFLRQIDIEGAARADIDFHFETGASLAMLLDAGKPIVVLAGLHPGCYELFANEPIETVADLKGRRVGIQGVGTAGHLYLAVMAAQVGLDPHRDIDWVARPDGNFMALLADGRIDAFLAFPPEPQELRARGIGRMILSLTTDKPWSQYFCCMAFGNRAFVQAHPVATKRYLRALLKAADLCATDPAMAARRLVEAGLAQRYDHALQTLTELPYTSWREYDPEDTLRFYALRLHELGMIETSPKEIVARGTDWRFLDEIKRELKA